MTDVFAKAVADLKLGDFAGDVPAPPKLQQPSSLDLLREQGVVGGNGSRRSIDVVGDLIRMERNKKTLAKLQGTQAAAAAIPPWATAVAAIPGYDALPYDQKKAAHDQYLKLAVAQLAKADPKTDPLLLEQQVLAQAPAPVDPTGGKGDVARAFSSGISNTKAAATGALGFMLDKFGNDAAAKEMYDSMAVYTKQAQDMGKANDTLSEALKPGGSLVDWAQYNVGQILPSLVESVITGAAGAAVGTAAGGVGAVPLAVAGAFGRTALKKKFAQSAEAFMREHAKKSIASGMPRAAALTAAREATELELKRSAGKTLGALGGIFGAAYARGVGEIAQNAQEAGIDPGGLNGLEVLSGAGLYAAMEGFSDKLLLGAFKGTTGGVVKRTLKRGAGTALAEGATEVGQDTVTGMAAGVGAPDGLAMFNAFAAGAVGGGVVGGAGAALRPADDAAAPPSAVDPNAPVELTDEELAATTADAATVAPGTTLDLGNNAILITGADGRWGYAPGSTPNADADTIMGLTPSAPGAGGAVGGQATPAPDADLDDDFDDDKPMPIFDGLPEGVQAVYPPGSADNPTIEWLVVDEEGSTYTGPTQEGALISFDMAQQERDANIQRAQRQAQETAERPDTIDISGIDSVDVVDGDVQIGATSIEARLEPFRGQLGDPGQAPFEALQAANAVIAQLTPEQRRAEIEQNPNGALARFTDGLGMQVTIGMEPGSTWARSIQNQTDGERVLRDLQLSGDAGIFNRQLSSLLQSAFQASGVAIPNVVWQQNPPPIRLPDGRQTTSYLGSYTTNTHTVSFNPRTTANTVLHEMMHGLTVKGLIRIQQFADSGEQNAQDVLQLIREMHAALVTAAGRRSVYGAESVQEMYAEMVRPEFIALAARTPFRVSQASASAQRGATHVAANQNGTMLEAISRLISYILQTITGERSIPPATVLGALHQTAAYVGTQTGRSRSMRANPNTTMGLDGPNAPAPAPTATLTREEINARGGRLTGEEARALADDTSYTVGERAAFGLYADGLINAPELRQRLGMGAAAAATNAAAAQDTAGLPAGFTISAPSPNESMWVVTLPAEIAGRAMFFGDSRETAIGNAVGWVERNSSPPFSQQVTPGQPLPVGTIVNETPRDRALLPPPALIQGLREMNPSSTLQSAPFLAWFFQPGAVFSRQLDHYVVIERTGSYTLVQPISPDGEVRGPAYNYTGNVTAGMVLRSLPSGVASVTVGGGGTRVTPGQPLPDGTLVEETPRNQALMPASENIDAIRRGSPDDYITLEINRRWYFQPGSIVRGSTGNDVVIAYSPGGTGSGWEVTVQSVDAAGRASGDPRTHSTAPTFGAVATTLPPAPPRSTQAPTRQNSQIVVPGPASSQPSPDAMQIDMSAATSTNPVSALLAYAKRRALRRTLRRGVQRMRGFGRLVPETATQQEKFDAFVSQFRKGLREIGATLRVSRNSFTVTMANGRQTSGDIMANGTSYDVAVGTTGLQRGSGAGGQFYDVLYGAIVASRMRVYNGAYTNDNDARLPINRLRAILKYGAITGDFNNAARALSMNHRNNWTPEQALSANIEAVRLRVERIYPGARFSADGRSIEHGNGESITLAQLRENGRQPTNNVQLQAASPDAVLLIAQLRKFETAVGAGERNRLIADAMANPETELLFSFAEDTITDDGEVLLSMSGDAPVEVDNDVRPERRMSVDTLITNMRTGAPASPATPTRGLVQAAQARDGAAFSRARYTLYERINEELHDASIRMKRWLQTLPVGDRLTEMLKQSVIGSMYTARKRRDDILRRFYDDHIADIDKAVTAFAAKNKISLETATRDIGYLTTAKTIPARNAFLLSKRIKALRELRGALEAAEEAQLTETTEGMVPEAEAAANTAPTQDTNVDELRRQYALAQVQLTELIAAINNQNTRVQKHGGGGVAGMNNAQAAAILAGLREQYGASGYAEIEAVANRIYTMNAAKLALDIESGKTTPAMAASFLQRPAALGPMQELRELANRVDAENPASVAALEAKRKQVIAAVKTEYVPLSGDPTKDIDDSSFHGGSGIPNVQRDYELAGRERGSPPDDGLSTSRAALMKSASYYGWRDFQDGIAAIHAALTTEERRAVGIRAETLEPGRSTLSNKAVIRNRNGSTTAYVFDDETLVDAIRGASRLENNFLLEGAGKITKAYSYLATQANPFFAPFNFIRDSWERYEFLRTRTYLRGNGSKANSAAISNGMLKYLADPSLLKATARYAMGRPVDVNSRTGRYLDEFLRQGGVSVFSSQFGADRAKMIAQISKQKSWRQQLGSLDRWISTYNKTFDVGPALASYMAMRDAGMNTKDAAAGALDLMDFGKRGKSASVFGSLYAFAQPTFTGAANAITALRDPLTGKMNPVGVARLGAYVAGFLMVQAFVRSLADDDEGGNKLDQQSGFVKNNFLLIPYGEDGMIKVPLAYGLTRVANGIARAALGVGTNEQTPGEAVGKLVSGSVVPVFSPIEDSDINWLERPAQALMTLFAPSWLKPPLALATNTTPFDTQIVNMKYADPTKFKSEQFGKYAPEDYKAMAKALRGATGIDMAPEEIRYLFRAYPTGVLQLAIQGPLEGKTIGDSAQGKVYAQYSEFARYFQFKKALDETDDLLKRTKAGEQVTDPMERRKLMWRLQWDEQDKELRSAKGKATRAAKKAGVGGDAIDGQFADVRMASQVRALYRYRLMQGKDAVVGEPVDNDK